MKGFLRYLGLQQKEGYMNSKGETELEPPWITMPDYPMISMAWKMGSGELVSWKFQIRYRALSKSSKENFRRKFPEPEGWEGYYSLILLGTD